MFLCCVVAVSELPPFYLMGHCLLVFLSVAAKQSLLILLLNLYFYSKQIVDFHSTIFPSLLSYLTCIYCVYSFFTILNSETAIAAFGLNGGTCWSTFCKYCPEKWVIFGNQCIFLYVNQLYFTYKSLFNHIHNPSLV